MEHSKINQSIQEIFEVAHGTITGSDHKWSGRNNQDSFHWLSNDKAIVAVVCDGCGGAKHSEIGSKIASRFLTEFIFEEIQNYQILSITHINGIISHARYSLLNLAHYTASKINYHNFKQALIDYFLFTVIGVILTEENSIIFSAGDGVFIVNEKSTIIGPFPNNEPPYVTYELISDSPQTFQIQQISPTQNINNTLIGTDGVSDLIKCSELNLPGKKEKVGLISQFWENDTYFKNPEMINRKLNLVNRDVI
jgi:hypothetical protein